MRQRRRPRRAWLVRAGGDRVQARDAIAGKNPEPHQRKLVVGKSEHWQAEGRGGFVGDEPGRAAAGPPHRGIDLGETGADLTGIARLEHVGGA